MTLSPTEWRTLGLREVTDAGRVAAIDGKPINANPHTIRVMGEEWGAVHQAWDEAHRSHDETNETAPTDEAREDRWASENEPVDDGYGEDHGGY